MVDTRLPTREGGQHVHPRPSGDPGLRAFGGRSVHEQRAGLKDPREGVVSGAEQRHKLLGSGVGRVELFAFRACGIGRSGVVGDLHGQPQIELMVRAG